jgi:hypothetical protein
MKFDQLQRCELISLLEGHRKQRGSVDSTGERLHA